MKFSERVKEIAAQEPFADLQDRLIALGEMTEKLALERKSIMCDRAETSVLEKLAEVQSRVINPTKALLKDRDSGIKALVKVCVPTAFVVVLPMCLLAHKHHLPSCDPHLHTCISGRS